jgi:hypothetical protein
MSSKAKSGMSAVRQFFERIRGLTPPNDYVVGDPSFTGPIRDGQGHAAVHIGVSNNTSGTLRLLQAWRSTGPFVQTVSVITALDPVTGLFTAEIVSQVTRRFIKVIFEAPAPGLGAAFEVGGYFEPRSDSDVVTTAGGVPIVPASAAPVPGVVITSPADTVVAPAATVPLPVPPAGTRRMTIEVTGGSALTKVRIREVGGVAGAGRLLTILASTMYGGVDGAIAPLEAENVAGPAAAVSISFEG